MKNIGFEDFLTQTIKEAFSGHQSTIREIFIIEKSQAFNGPDLPIFIRATDANSAELWP